MQRTTASEPSGLTDSDEFPYLTFRLREETFAIGILSIKEIIEYGSFTPVPMMPRCVRGVINLRGRVVPVIDLSVRFGREETVPNRRTCVVIIEVGPEGERQDLGVLVDAVNQVVELPAKDIEPAPGFGSRVRAEFIAGMGKLNGELVIILDVDRVLSANDLAALMPSGNEHEAA